MVHTALSRHMPAWQLWLSWPFRYLLLRSPQQGAAAVVYAATSPELRGHSGHFLGAPPPPPSFFSAAKTSLWPPATSMSAEETVAIPIVASSPASQSEELAALLWSETQWLLRLSAPSACVSSTIIDPVHVAAPNRQ